MAQNILSISEFEDFNEWKRDGNVIRNSDGSYSTQDANFRNRLEDMEELQRYYKREFVGSYAKGGKLKVGDKFGNYSVTLYEPITYDDLGSSSGGKVKLVNQADFDTIIIQYDNALRGGEWFVSKNRKKYIGKNPQEVISKLNLNMENMYKIVDVDGDTVESNLNEQEVIEFADSLGYYEAQDNEEEPIYDIDSAISLIEMEGDYTVVKMSEYGGSVYAKGGKVAKFDAYEVAGELAELADGVWDKLGITDGGMLYNDESLQAKVNEEYAKAGIDKMFKALSTVNRKKVAEALTDENNHNVRNYLALRGYLGVAEKRSYTNLFKKSGNFKIVLNPTIFGVKPLVSDISTYVPHSKVLSITIKKGDKEYNLTGSDILDGVYVKDGEFKRGGVMKTLRRWWKKLNGTWYYNEGAGWRRDRKFQNKSEKYEKDGRSTYKQVTRGYVDDMPYEYADGGWIGSAIVYEYDSQIGLEQNDSIKEIAFSNFEDADKFARKESYENKRKFVVYNVPTGQYFFYGLKEMKIYAKGGYVDMREKLTKELMKLQRELNSSRLNSYREGDNSEAEIARRRERESKLARFNDILKTLNQMDKSPKYAKGGDVTVPEKIEYSSMFSAIPRSTDNENVV